MYQLAFSSSAVSILFSLINGALLARMLTVEGRGLLAEAMLASSIASTAALLLFVPQAYTTIIIKNKNKRLSKFFIKKVSLQIAFGLLVFVSFWILSNNNTFDPSLVIATSFLMVTNICYQVQCAICRGFNEFNSVSISQPISVLLVACLLILLYRSHSATAAMSAYCISFFLVCMFLHGKLRNNLSGQINQVSEKHLIVKNKHREFSVLELILLCNSSIDKLLILQILTLDVMAMYTIASSVAGMVLVLCTATAPIIFAQLSELKLGVEVADNCKLIESKIAIVYRISTIVVILCAPVAYILLPYVYGDQYAAAKFSMLIMIAGVYFKSNATGFDTALRSCGLSKQSIYIYLTSTMVIVTLFCALYFKELVNVPLIPPIVYAISAFVELILFVVVSAKHLKINPSNIFGVACFSKPNKSSCV